MRRFTRWQPEQGWETLLDEVGARWEFADWGWEKRGLTYRVSTGGWSGNEELLAALRKNFLFWSTCWVSSRRGGHYVFRVPKELRRAVITVHGPDDVVGTQEDAKTWVEVSFIAKGPIYGWMTQGQKR